MKQVAARWLRRFVTPSVRFELREAAEWLREQRNRARFGHWQLVRVAAGLGSCDVFYWGRKDHQPLAMAMLGIDRHVSTIPERLSLSSHGAFIGDLPLPGSLRVPAYLRAIVPLGRPLEEIMTHYDSELRRRLRKQRPRFRTRRVLETAEVERIDRDMLRPYVTERHEYDASQLAPDVVLAMAQDYGRLDLLYCDDEEVGCHLGHELTRAGKRYWVTSRFGYPAGVFSDRKRLAEINSMNTFMALEHAAEQGYDHYDIGMSLGRPDNGLLQWKRRRGGALGTMLNHTFLYVRLPKRGRAQFLWDAPLFALEPSGLTLWLGLPDGKSDEEAATRYREMGFGGLSRVYVHSSRPPGQKFVERLRGQFAHYPALPAMRTIQAD
jgi:hypothetical protein